MDTLCSASLSLSLSLSLLPYSDHQLVSFISVLCSSYTIYVYRQTDIFHIATRSVKHRRVSWSCWCALAGHQMSLCVCLSITFTFIRRFYPKRLTIAFRLYIFISTCVPWESNPQPFAQQTQCSTAEPHRSTWLVVCCWCHVLSRILSDPALLVISLLFQLRHLCPPRYPPGLSPHLFSWCHQSCAVWLSNVRCYVV